MILNTHPPCNTAISYNGNIRRYLIINNSDIQVRRKVRYEYAAIRHCPLSAHDSHAFSLLCTFTTSHLNKNDSAVAVSLHSYTRDQMKIKKHFTKKPLASP